MTRDTLGPFRPGRRHDNRTARAAALALFALLPCVVHAETPPAFTGTVDLLAARHGDYLAKGDEPPVAFSDTGRVTGVQIERNETGLRLGALTFPNLFEALYKRHGEAAAFIFDRTADIESRADIPVYNVTDGFFDFPTGDFRRLIEAADVISLSQVSGIDREEGGAFSGNASRHASSDGIEALRALWAGTDTAVFHAIGNDAAALDRSYPETNLNWIFNDLYVRVGTGHARPDGSVAVDANSPANAVTLLTEIPNVRYRLFTEPETAYRRTYAYLERNRAFYETALLRAVADGGTSPFNLGQCRGRTEADRPFEGRELLDGPTFQQAAAPLSDLFRAYSACARETLASYYARRDRDPARSHDLRAVGGTSFSTPRAAGLFLAALQRHPELGKHDILAAMILSARPADVVAGAGGAADAPVTATRNGRGLVRSRAAGFGLVTADDFASKVEALAALRRDRPALQTTERDTVSDIATWRDAAPEPVGGFREYQVRVTDETLFMRGVLVMSFGGGNERVPADITLIDPQGGEAALSPARYKRGSRLVMAGTDAFFGVNAAGTWRVRVPEPFTLAAAGLSIEGVEAGPDSLIDRFLTGSGHPAARDLEIAAPAMTEPKL